MSSENKAARAEVVRLAGPVFEWTLGGGHGGDEADVSVWPTALSVTSPSGRRLTVPAFRAGHRWSARLWADEPGTWQWRTGAADGAASSQGGADGCAHGIAMEGGIENSPEEGSRWCESPLRTGAMGRHFETRDGRPFFYLGDTAWFVTFKGTEPDWERYLDERAAQGYSAVQIHLLPFKWDEPDPEGNLPFVDEDVARPNEPYFARVDRFCALAAARGLYVMMALMWGGNRRDLAASHFSAEQAVAFARYAVARYAAFPMLWSLSGDAPYVEDLEKWEAVGAAVEATDPHHHPTTNHLPPTMNWRFLHHASAWHDFHMLQTGHRRGNTADIAALPAAYWMSPPAKPVVNGEPWYEGHPEMEGWGERFQRWRREGGTGERPAYGAPFTAFDARYAFWTSVLGGATMGHGYGAQGLWNWKRAGDSEDHLGGPQIGPTWEEGLALAGGRECGIGAQLLRAVPWWKLEPCPERVEVTGGPPHAEGSPLKPACARAAGEAWVAYVPAVPGPEGRVTLKGLEDGDWSATWIDPRTGARHDAGRARAALDGCWRTPPTPHDDDWVLVLVR